MLTRLAVVDTASVEVQNGVWVSCFSLEPLFSSELLLLLLILLWKWNEGCCSKGNFLQSAWISGDELAKMATISGPERRRR